MLLFYDWAGVLKGYICTQVYAAVVGFSGFSMWLFSPTLPLRCIMVVWFFTGCSFFFFWGASHGREFCTWLTSSEVLMSRASDVCRVDGAMAGEMFPANQNMVVLVQEAPSLLEYYSHVLNVLSVDSMQTQCVLTCIWLCRDFGLTSTYLILSRRLDQPKYSSSLYLVCV